MVITQAEVQSVTNPITQTTRQTYVHAAEVTGDVQIAVRDREEQYRNFGIDLIGQQKRYLRSGKEMKTLGNVEFSQQGHINLTLSPLKRGRFLGYSAPVDVYRPS